MEKEDADPVGGPAADALQTYTGLAAKHGLIRSGDKLDQNMVDFAAALCEIARPGEGHLRC